MKKTMLTGLLACGLAVLLHAQHSEYGVYAGVTAYHGELSAGRLDVREMKEAYGALLRMNFTNHFAVRFLFGGGRMGGDDANTPATILDYEAKLERNLSFRSSYVEGGGVVEFNLFGYQPYNLRKVFSPYLFAGFTLFKFNPRAYYQDEWYALQPLGTEGQGNLGFAPRYSLVNAAIPLGVGVKFAINDLWNATLEAGARRTFTDYLDDVGGTYVARDELIALNGVLAADLANRTGEYLGTEPVSVPTGTPRANTDTKDWFTVINLSLSYNLLDNGLVGSRRRVKRPKSGCPTGL